MATTTFNSSLTATYPAKAASRSLFQTFINWSAAQQENRLLWLGIALAAHGCFLTPVTVFVVLLAGNSLALLIAAIATMVLTLVANLAAMPTKITIPVFVLTILIDIVIILSCVAAGLENVNIF